MAFEQNANFATSTVATAPSPADSGTSLVVASGEGARFDAANDHNAIVCPASEQPTPANAEIVRVTAVSTDTLTITRQQESTAARSIVVGDRIFAGPTAKTFADVDTQINAAASFSVTAHSADTTDVHGIPNTANFDAVLGLPGVYAPYGGHFNTSAVALTASRAYFARVKPMRAVSVTAVAFIVTTVSSGNDTVDVGVYTVSGSSLNRVAASGPTSGTLNSGTGVKTISLSASLTAGTVYYAAMAIGTITGGSPGMSMASATNGILDLPGTTLGTTLGPFKAATTLDATISSLSTNAGGVPLMFLRE
jgi:hypothetical protein